MASDVASGGAEGAEKPEGGAPRGGPDASAIVVLDTDECREVLRNQRLGILAVVDGEAPYAIPMFYGFDERTIYLGISEGKKTRLLDANPRVSVTVTEVGPGEGWRAVIVAGRAEWITEPAERQEAIQVLTAHNRKFARAPAVSPPGASGQGSGGAPGRKHSSGRMMRVGAPVITGRAKR